MNHVIHHIETPPVIDIDIIIHIVIHILIRIVIDIHGLRNDNPGVLEGVTPTESGFKCLTCDKPLPQVFKQKEVCASTPKDSTTTVSLNTLISSTASIGTIIATGTTTLTKVK